MGTVVWITLLEESFGWWCNVMFQSLRPWSGALLTNVSSSKYQGPWVVEAGTILSSCLKLLFFFFKICILMWTIFKVFIEFVAILFLFHISFFVCLVFYFLGCGACGISAPWPGIEHTPHALEGEILTTGLPGSLNYLVLMTGCLVSLSVLVFSQVAFSE